MSNMTTVEMLKLRSDWRAVAHRTEYRDSQGLKIEAMARLVMGIGVPHTSHRLSVSAVSGDHTRSIDGGHTVMATPTYLVNPANVDAEQACVAALSSH